MKRSEVIAHARVAVGEVALTPREEEAAVYFACRLGIKVEPDEEPLPERVALSWSPPMLGGLYDLSIRNEHGNVVCALEKIDHQERRLIDAAFAAYNERRANAPTPR